MLTAYKANELANERIEAQVKDLLDEVERLIRERCEIGCKCATWEAQHVPERTRRYVIEELWKAGYDANVKPWQTVVIRW